MAEHPRSVPCVPEVLHPHRQPRKHSKRRAKPKMTTAHPRSFKFVSEVVGAAQWMQGTGSAQFWLPLLREPVTVAYVREDDFKIGLWE